MSGPKYSAAELERMRQEALERERQEALRKLKEAQEEYRGVCEQAEQVKRGIAETAASLPGFYVNTVKQRIGELVASIRMPSLSGSSSTEEYKEASQKARERLEHAKHELDALFGELFSRVNTQQTMDRNSSAKQALGKAMEGAGQMIRPGFLDFSGDCEEKDLIELLRKLQDYFSRMSRTASDPRERAFDEKCAKKLQKMLEEPVAASDAGRIHAVQEAMYNEEAEIRRKIREFADRYADYVAVSSVLHYAPKPPSDFHSAEELKKASDALMAQYRKKDEMDYIADRINEVMVDLGYGFVSSNVLMRKDNTEADVSLYRADERTGIAVYTDQSGAVMMRMTVLGDSGDITDEDREFSYQRQIDFCAGHQDIVDALAKKGVYFKQISYSAPDRKHTYKQVIKTGASSTGSTAGQTAGGTGVNGTSGKTKVDRRKRRRDHGKAMHAV